MATKRKSAAMGVRVNILRTYSTLSGICSSFLLCFLFSCLCCSTKVRGMLANYRGTVHHKFTSKYRTGMSNHLRNARGQKILWFSCKLHDNKFTAPVPLLPQLACKFMTCQIAQQCIFWHGLAGAFRETEEILCGKK
jgi:hypothetical protein